MIIKIDMSTEVDTDRDLSAAERHVLQKLFGWKTMVDSVKVFRQKKKTCLAAGWNNSGPIKESRPMALVTRRMEQDIQERLKST